ncbi:MAG TPA: DUF222 domain-containing protein [Candidatus Caenarcaniphilales bacterium]|nr:DUF222 domain-containing protein [Candidatus Caenarcaniphilales bacterium]
MTIEHMFDKVKDMGGAVRERLAGYEVRAAFQRDRLEILEEFRHAAASAGAAECRLLRTIASCDRAELWREDGCRNTMQWVSQRLGVSRWKAARFVHAGRVLHRLPLTSAALERGALSLDKVLELCRFATPETETALVKWATKVTVGSIRERGDLEIARSLEKVKKAQDERYVQWWRSDDDEMLCIQAMLPSDQGAKVTAAIDRLAAQIPAVEAQGGDTAAEQPSICQRRADALVQMASVQIAGDEDSDRASVVVHATLDALSRDEGNGQVARGPVLHPETVRKFSCDARLQFVLHGKDGNAVGIGRTSEVVPRWLRRQMLHRDGHRCTFPNCEARRFLHAHHIHHWARGGVTDLDNLTTLCSAHHDLVHEGRWSVHRDASGELIWFRAGGRMYRSGLAPPTPGRAEEPRSERDRLRLIETRGYSRLLALAAAL